MSTTPSAQMSSVARFRALHEAGCFVMPNPWDAGSAIALARLGFTALATTSSGMAFARGRPDSERALNLGIVVEHVCEIVAATSLPVNADFQSGHGEDPEAVAASVTACVRAGVAGLSVEDATGDPAAPLFARGVAIERLRAARAAIDATGIPVVLTARCEAWLVGDPDAKRTAIDRLVAFADEGADCLFAPGVRDLGDIAELALAVAPKPLNVLVSAPGLTVAQLADAGARRISTGSALARVAWGAFLRAAASLEATGSFDCLDGAAPFGELNAMFEQENPA